MIKKRITHNCPECGRLKNYDDVEGVEYCPNCDDGFMDAREDLWWPEGRNGGR